MKTQTQTHDEACAWNSVRWIAGDRRVHCAASWIGQRPGAGIGGVDRQPDAGHRGGGAPAAAAAPSAPSAPAVAGAPIGTTGFKECSAEGLIDDGEDGNNQNMPNDNRGGYWYTFRDKKGDDDRAGRPARTAAPSR